ncbi:transposon tf2-6 polyprotein [Plakobranchus ocellatus]|uniref:Transposon tf2-6 polyprotein n=1 Tax=Plakobranchus ocellatus TaxID=259542 RepID=A0AAV4D060_9GAST|nr:transposon tf2-6 polyprotein [Plakobranchus ocellatus]
MPILQHKRAHRSTCRKKETAAARQDRQDSPGFIAFLSGYPINFKVDIGSRDSFISLDRWHQINRPQMSQTSCKYRCASNQNLPVLGVIKILRSTAKGEKPKQERFLVTRLPLNIIGCESCKSLVLSLDQPLFDNVKYSYRDIEQDQLNFVLFSLCLPL